MELANKFNRIYILAHADELLCEKSDYKKKEGYSCKPTIENSIE